MVVVLWFETKPAKAEIGAVKKADQSLAQLLLSFTVAQSIEVLRTLKPMCSSSTAFN